MHAHATELMLAPGYTGTLISRDLYDGIRLATPADVPGMLSLIEPLEAQGILAKRERSELLRDVSLVV